MRIVVLSESMIGEMREAWNREWADRFPIGDRLLRQNIFQDPNWFQEGSWAAVDEAQGRIAGFVVSKVWQSPIGDPLAERENGWIGALLVDAGYRRKGIGSLLLAKAEAAFRERNVRKIMLGNDFHYRFFPGVPHSETLESQEWFARKGYAEVGVVRDLQNDYKADEGEAEMPTIDGVSFRMLEPGEEERLLSFMQRCFPGRWAYQTEEYFRRGGTGREFVVLVKEWDIIGFCRINDAKSPILAQNVYWSALFEEELGGVGPLGVEESQRGNKYGLAVVQAGIAELRRRGVRSIVIDTTPFVDFYGKLGYTVWRSYSRFEKLLGGDRL